MAQHWTQKEDADDLWHGLRLFAVDGTLFRTLDTSESADHFEYIKHRPDPTLLCSQKVTGIYQEIWGITDRLQPDPNRNESDSQRGRSIAIEDQCRDSNEADTG